jgi:two-component system response regulator GlrR
MNVMIVDDDVLLSRALSRALEASGHSCLTASSVEGALHVLATNRPALVLTDLDLGGAGDGVDLARWLRGSGVTVPIVMMTGSDVELARRELSRAGLDGIEVLPKPFALRRLLAIFAARTTTTAAAAGVRS